MIASKYRADAELELWLLLLLYAPAGDAAATLLVPTAARLLADSATTVESLHRVSVHPRLLLLRIDLLLLLLMLLLLMPDKVKAMDRRQSTHDLVALGDVVKLIARVPVLVHRVIRVHRRAGARFDAFREPLHGAEPVNRRARAVAGVPVAVRAVHQHRVPHVLVLAVQHPLAVLG